LEKAVLTGLALNCEIQPRSRFDQKIYYYPDLPKGYQLSQVHDQFARNGWLEIIGGEGKSKRLRIREVHMEEDVARLVHETEGRTKISLVDFNRAGAPLVEIVTEPDMRSPRDAMEFLRDLRRRIRYAGTAECSLEEGTMRVDANISIRPRGTDLLNTRVEVKNMNSIRHVGEAIAHEIERQIERVKAGHTIVLHTRLWNPELSITTPMREKFAGPGVPDPSVPEILITKKWLDTIRARLPEMPDRRRAQFVKEYGLTPEEAALMSSERDLAEYFERTANACSSPRAAAGWIGERLLPALKERSQTTADTPVTPKRLAELLEMIDREEISVSAGKEVFGLLFESDRGAREIVKEHGLRQVSDTTELERIVDQVITENPDAVQDFHNGKKQAVGFLVGRAMRASRGKANPKLVKKILDKKLT
ncbi:MAG: Asp-tRNA(Asn)/Glu-tRNA(Gln) amidotransferase subunit GatB, partial [Candidatus Auribacterota bacterium]|nr:Asp-tRNA(Asn)/Glu-tRNA(Gln) amidotransferase subunit GatB [Candidatus Auribacterota bacterium]